MIKYNLHLNPFPSINLLLSNKSYSTSVNPNVDNSNFNLALPAFSIDAPKVFTNVLCERIEMSKQLRGQSGIYCWINLLNGKYYIGSGVDLGNRVNDYFQDSYYKSRTNTIIVRAILKYGIGNFALVILDFCDKEDLLSQEDHFIKTLNPEYNILQNAGNSLGYKHTPESIDKIIQSALGRTHSLEVRKAMSESRMGANNPMFGKIVSDETKAKLSEAAKNRVKSNKPGLIVEVLDLENNITTEYQSIREAARSLSTNVSSLLSREKRRTVTPYKGRYVINIKRP